MPPNSTSSGVRWTDYNRAQATCNINATYSGATCTKVQCASSLLADADGDATNGCEKKVTAAPTSVSPTRRPTTAKPTTKAPTPALRSTDYSDDNTVRTDQFRSLHSTGVHSPSRDDASVACDGRQREPCAT